VNFRRENLLPQVITIGLRDDDDVGPQS